MVTHLTKILIPLGITAIFIVLSSQSSWFVEHIYFRFLFQFQRILHDFTLGFLPIPSIYLALFLVFIVLIWLFKRAKTWIQGLMGLLQVVAWLFFFFYLSWGCNYYLKPLETRLSIPIPTLTEQDLTEMFKNQTAKLIEARSLVDEISMSGLVLEEKIRPILEGLLESWDLPTISKMRVRIIPSGSLLHFRTTGMYIPHAYEGHVDGGLYSVQWPFTLAHEMAHGYGITYESDCNFIAYLTCLESEDPLIRYSGELAYWRYLASQVASFDRENYEAVRHHIEDDIQQDLQEIRKHIDRYKDWMPNYRTVIYDNYLKTHGIKEAVKNYDRMILLVEGWNRSVE